MTHLHKAAPGVGSGPGVIHRLARPWRVVVGAWLWLLVAACVTPALAQDEAGGPGVLEFAFVTDTHAYGSTVDVRKAGSTVHTFVDYCNQRPQIRFALHGGDLYNDYDTNHEQAMWCLRQAQRDFAAVKAPMYFTRGNHDTNGKCRTKDGRPDNTQIVTDAEYHRLFSPLSPDNPHYGPDGIVGDSLQPYRNYYYRDFPDHKFRLVVLNNYCQDSMEMFGVHGQQLKWLAETALDFSDKGQPEEWCFMLMVHAFTINYRNNPAARMLHAYVRGEDFRDTDQGISYEGHFGTPRRARLVAVLTGHFHEDLYDNWDGYNLIICNHGYATAGDLGTPSEICFDHFVLDTRRMTLEQRRMGRGVSHLYSYDKARMVDPQLSVPELEGIGNLTHGGRGGRRIRVTNLKNSGRGSLRWAVSQRGCREVLFDVAGTIRLTSPLVIDQDSITIFGQSSPDPGITIKGAPVVITASNVIVRYLTLLDGITDGDFGQQDVVLSHLTVAADHGDALTMRRTYQGVVQDCLITGAGPGRAGLVAGGALTCYAYNYIKDCATAIQLPDEPGCNRAVQLSRNLIENWRDHCMIGGGHQGEYSIGENIALPGPHTANLQLLEVAADGTGRYYLKYNWMKGREECMRRNALMVTDRSGLPYRPDTTSADYWRMHPYARPHYTPMARSCLTIAAFQSKYVFGNVTEGDLIRRMRRLAGSGYRPETVCRDSLSVPDVEAYLDRIMHPEKTIVILYEGDVHCAIDNYPYLVGLREVLRHDSCSIGVVTAGDFLQGGMESTISEGRAITRIMHTIGYDAISPGMHDFDYGIERRHEIFGDMMPAITSMNLHDNATDSLVFAPYVIRRYDRRKVAFIGVTSPQANLDNTYALRDKDGKVRYHVASHHLYDHVQRVVDHVRKHEGAQYVVLLSRLGRADDRFDLSTPGLVAATTGIDVVIDGENALGTYQMRQRNKDGHTVLVSQAGDRFSHIGKLVIDPDDQIYCELVATDRLIYKDPYTAFIVDSIRDVIAHTADLPACRSLVDLCKPTPTPLEPGQINAGQLAADAMRYVAQSQIAWINGGSVRLPVLKSGSLKEGDILNLLPYHDHLCTLRVKGSALARCVATLLREYQPDKKPFAQMSGMRIQAEAKSGSYRATHIEVLDAQSGGYVPLQPDDTYTFCTTRYYLSRLIEVGLTDEQPETQAFDITYGQAFIRYAREYLHGIIRETDSQDERFRLVQ